MSHVVDKMALAGEQDVVVGRQRARTIAALAGFDLLDQARIATAVSEIARNAVRYARGGRIEFALGGDEWCRALEIRIADDGPGIRDLAAILDGAYVSASGMGLGLVGARRLMDRCDVASDARGTRVAMTKFVRARPNVPMQACVERVRDALVRSPPASPVEDGREQQRELLVALSDAREHEEQLAQLNRELEDTNRGVVALYAELDEKALRLRQADETKSRFLSSISHELRTPLNSIRALAGLLLARVDGPLNDEQAHQVELIRTAVNDLTELVEDLLDIGRIEAGKLDIRDGEFTADDLFRALRGMLRPLITGDAVTLRFEPPEGVPPIVSDEGKVAQVLRNFISNALKFTERGSVSVAARRLPGDGVEFVVADTGIGIAPEDQERIFEEFVQVQGPLQRRAKGSGLGLTLCRRIAQALGGSVRVESSVGEGSRFFLTLPRRRAAGEEVSDGQRVPARGATSVLVVEDDAVSRYALRRLMEDAGFAVIETATAAAGLRAAASDEVDAIVLDLGLPDVDGFTLLDRLGDAPATRDIPVVICTSRPLSDAERGRLVSRAFRILDKSEMQAHIVAAVNAACARANPGREEAA